MLVMRTIKDPPDNVSGFTADAYAYISELLDSYGSYWAVRRSINVQITSQVERGELEGVAVEEHSDTDKRHDEDDTSEGAHDYYDFRGHPYVEGEGSRMEADMERDVECTDDGGTMDTGPVAAATGDNDQEGTSEHTEPHQWRSVSSGEDELDIQFVRVITT